jgi:hypothetical protein
VLAEKAVTGDLSHMRTKADKVAELPLDPMLEIARWPEWGVERWEEIDRTEVLSFHLVSGGDEREQPQEVPSGKEMSEAPASSGHRGIAVNKPRKNISRIALGIMVGLLFLGGHFYGFKMSSADVPAPRPAAADPPPLRSTLIAQPARHPATAAPAVIPKAAVSLTLPDGIAAPLRPPANGANSMPQLRLYSAGVPVTAPMTPPKPVSQPQHAVLAAHKSTRSRAVAHRVSAKTDTQSARYVSTRACIRLYPETGRCH